MAGRRFVPRWALVVMCLAGLASEAMASAPTEAVAFVVDGGDLEAMAAEPVATPFQGPPAPASVRPVAFEYSDGFRTRLKIHKYASYATIPLFAAQYVVGQKLYDGTGSDSNSDSTRAAHTALAAATAALFTVNTVTGVWNFKESRRNPTHRTKRTIHGVLMLVADAGFVATGLMAPENENEGGVAVSSGNRSAHRTVALTSMGIATVSYLIMLLH